MNHQGNKGHNTHHRGCEWIDQEANIQIELTQLHPAIYSTVEVETIHDLHEYVARQNKGNHHTQDGHKLACAMPDSVTAKLSA